MDEECRENVTYNSENESFDDWKGICWWLCSMNFLTSSKSCMCLVLNCWLRKHVMKITRNGTSFLRLFSVLFIGPWFFLAVIKAWRIAAIFLSLLTVKGRVSEKWSHCYEHWNFSCRVSFSLSDAHIVCV